MFVPFESLAPTSRLWVYQADRKLKPEEKTITATLLTQYCDAWVAHGQPLRASFDIRYDHFIILAVDESVNATSGCSIDDSVRAIKKVEALVGASFFNRTLIGFLVGQDVKLLELARLKENFHQGIWNEQTLSFNNLITSKSQLETDWITPAASSWLKRYIPQTTARV